MVPFWLCFAAGDTLVFADERYRFVRSGHTPKYWVETGVGHKSPQLLSRADSRDPTAGAIRSILSAIKVYQFHNTSYTAGMRNKMGC